MSTMCHVTVKMFIQIYKCFYSCFPFFRLHQMSAKCGNLACMYICKVV